MMAEYGNITKGKILRVKTGYNPNSSSVGSQVPVFFFFAIASGICSVIAVQMLSAIDSYITKKKNSIKPGKQQ
jgi:hypothetical protein